MYLSTYKDCKVLIKDHIMYSITSSWKENMHACTANVLMKNITVFRKYKPDNLNIPL